MAFQNTMQTKFQLYRIYVHPRWKRMVFETYVESILWRQSINQCLTNCGISMDEAAHFLRDYHQSTSRQENLFVFMFIQVVMGVMAFFSALVENESRLMQWLIASFIFSIAMFILYRSLTIIVRGVRYATRTRQPTI
jgi:hypothetical protein